MSPVPQLAHSLHLHLTFPSLASLATTSHLDLITSCARRTSSLLILIHFDFPFLLPHPSSSSSSAGPSSSTSSSAPPVPAQTTTPTAATHFHLLQDFLSRAYGAATKVFIAEGRLLDSVDVVLVEMRGLAVCAGNGVEVVRRMVEDGREGVEEEVQEEEGGKEYAVTALGGTFDHLHAGHKILLTMAALITTRRLIAGISDAPLLGKKKVPHLLESLQVRQAHVQSFLELVRPGIVHDVVPIQDVYGPTAWDSEIEAIVVSDETRAGGDAVNEERAKRGLSQLDVYVIQLISAEADSQGAVDGKMGSTGIREWLARKEKLEV